MRGQQVRLVVRHRLPGAVQIVPLDRREVEVAEQLVDLEAAVDLRSCSRQERGQKVLRAGLLTVGVELLTELLHQRGEVLLVLRPDDVLRVPLGARPLPVEVDPVEDAGGCTGAAHATPARVGQVAFDEEIDA